MKYVLALVGIAVALLFLRHQRRMVRARRQQHSRKIEVTRVFKPESDPFDPNERIEFYIHKRD